MTRARFRPGAGAAVAQALVIGLVVAAGLALGHGCGGRTWAQNARVGVAASGHGLATLDALAARQYRADTADAGPEAFAVVDARYRALEHAELAARDALRALEAALDAHDAHPTESTKCAVLAAARAATPLLDRAAALARDLGATVPTDLAVARTALDAALATLSTLQPTCATDGGTP